MGAAMPLEKPIDQVVEADLRRLIEGQFSERKTIEYKQDLRWESNGERKEFLADVSSFANSSGGHLVYGMKEEGGLPIELSGLDVDDPDFKVAALDNSIRDGVKPRIPGVVVWPVGLESGKLAIVIRVPRSFASPHMVTYRGSSRFFARTSNGKYQLDVEEIRAAFLLSGKTAERVRDFRLDRIAKIRAEDTPVPLVQGAKIVLHVVPLSAFSSFAQIDLQSVAVISRELHFIPLGFVTGWDGRFNLEGYARYISLRDGLSLGYLQIFRTGALETVDTSLASHSAGVGYLRGANLKADVIEKLGYYLPSLKGLGVDVPLAVMISLLGVKGYRVGPQETAAIHGIGRFDRDVILVPELLLESFDADIKHLLKQTFDMVWNAAGWAYSFE
ncbi:MAG TPA: ATP-binding protein [Terriglobia bacterium]|nr:ATP-binding protein [Terriglobia bacterium]